MTPLPACPPPRLRQPALRALALLLALGGTLPSALAHQGSTGTNSSTANLDFVLNIGKFIFFRVGTGAFPTASATVDTVAFNAVPAIPAGAVVPVAGNNTTVVWNGALPAFTAAATSLPVEVRSNAGQISIRATATTPLNSGANNIPLSQIVLSSSDANLPAPVVPNTGTGPAVNVTGTAFSNLVTVRSANWTFSYNPLATQRAGVYTGQISFTASSP
ncbi:hypothetical protein [Variovorax terrae]|uniref:IPT/TIG domain-containing protein n=1 Tax=Variovorax terrae TaxID=2923278 RepID=A0A9X1VWY1_9BURK|nr:hypothetical protein [Variovorax terrae]MCJ0764770.1 hypothetical protein [Variovorax terrae]